MTGTVLLIFDVAVGLDGATAATGGVVVVLALLAIVPTLNAKRADHRGRDESSR